MVVNRPRESWEQLASEHAPEQTPAGKEGLDWIWKAMAM